MLSPTEAHYASTHAALLERHYSSLFLSSFPQKLRRLDDRAGAGGVGMVEGPDMDTAVFVRCLGRWRGQSRQAASRGPHGFEDDDEGVNGDHVDSAYGTVEISCGFTATSSNRTTDDTEGTYADERTETMRRGDIWIVRWSSVREAVARGECELI